MKAIMVMFDSLNRHMLPTYGCDWVHAPNFERLAKESVVFDRSFVGSMPCMPARREIHTGRYNFLHRSWGPIEPFDDSMPEILKEKGIYTHLVSDHYHYWEEGGCNYHTRYTSWEMARGQEGDHGRAYMKEPPYPKPNSEKVNSTKLGYQSHYRQDWVNRYFMQEEKDMPQAKTFAMGLDFIEDNRDCDDWFLQIETFDPHEPYCVPEKYKKLYDFDYSKFDEDWPGYEPVPEGCQDLVEHLKYTNAALISMCDNYLGKVLTMMDKYNMWEDTMLIINTDHGFMLGEHDWWGKCRMPMYNEVAHTPLFIWDPRCGKKGERRQSLVQTIDLPATLLEYFNVDRPKDMQGVPLRNTIEKDTPVREAGIFGIHGGPINCTDGQYVYMLVPATKENGPLYNYTHMPTNMRHTFSVESMRTVEIQPPFEFTKGCPVMKINAAVHQPKYFPGDSYFAEMQTSLYDIDTDPHQEKPLDNKEVESAMLGHIKRLMKETDAPEEQYIRMGIEDGNREWLVGLLS